MHAPAVSTESPVFSRRKADRPRVGKMNPHSRRVWVLRRASGGSSLTVKALLAVDAGSDVVELAVRRHRTGVGSRQPQLNGGSNVRCTVDAERTAGLSCYSLDHGKTQTGSHAGVFGGEKRFGRLGPRGFIHAHASIDNLYAHIIARRQRRVGGAGKLGLLGADHEPSTAGHGVARIE